MLSRDSPDESQTGINVRVFPALLQHITLGPQKIQSGEQIGEDAKAKLPVVAPLLAARAVPFNDACNKSSAEAAVL
jgi:hypothetical protein